MFRDLKEICFITEFEKIRDLEKYIIIIKSIDNLLIDNIDICLQIQKITRYVVNNVILTLFFF